VEKVRYEILAISGTATAALAAGYELIERPLWSWLHKVSGPGKNWLTGFAHEQSKEAALEHRTNTVGDVVLGSVAGFLGSYATLASFGRAPNLTFTLVSGIVVNAVASSSIGGVVYGGSLAGGTWETHTYDPVHDVFVLRDKPVP
jgi:hypothetical protein